MNLVVTKVIVLLLLAGVKLGSGLSPMLLVKLLKKEKLNWLEKFMSGLLCFGGGVLLATVFMHMLPDVQSSLDSAKSFKLDNYPYAQLLLCSGFFVIYFIEAFVHRIFHIHAHSHGFPGDVVQENNQNPMHHSKSFSQKVSESLKRTITLRSLEEHIFTMERDVSVMSLEELAAHQEQTKESEKKIVGAIRSFVIVLALSIHAIFEGMAIGLQIRPDGVWKLFGAVAIHECAILFCVGNDMVRKGMKVCQIVTYMITLGIVTPIGITIGIVLTLNVDANSDTQSLIIGLFQGLAGGTLLYITFYEVLDREKLESLHMNGIKGWALMVLGFGLMAGLEASGGEEDEHPIVEATTTAFSMP